MQPSQCDNLTELLHFTRYYTLKYTFQYWTLVCIVTVTLLHCIITDDKFVLKK